MRYINGVYFYEISRDNWQVIEDSYGLGKDFIKGYEANIDASHSRTNPKVNPKKFHYLSIKKFDDLCDELFLSPYDLEVKIDKNVLKTPTFRTKAEESKNNKTIIRKLVAKVNLFRQDYLIIANELKIPIYISENISIKSTNKDIIEYLGINTEEYKNRPLDNSYNSKIAKLKEKILSLGCMVFEIKINVKNCSGFFLGYSEWPIIVLNENEDASRKIFTLLHELYHFLSFKSRMKDSFSNASEKVMENTANNFASSILLPKEYCLEHKNELNQMNSKQLKDWLKTTKGLFGISIQAQMVALKKNGVFSEKKAKDLSEKLFSSKYKEIPIKKVNDQFNFQVLSEMGPSYVRNIYSLYKNGYYSKEETISLLDVNESIFQDIINAWT